MQQDRRSGWYDTSPHREWYRQYSTRQEATALKVPDRRDTNARKRKSRPGVAAGVISLLVLILIAATALAFGETPTVTLPGPGAENSPPAQDAQDGYADDFREFFDSYYSGYASSDEPSRLPRIKAADGVSMTLTSSGGLETLTLGQLYEQCADTVVGIAAGLDGRGYRWGTGIVMTGDGYILTNAHVISGADSAEVVTADGRQFEALLVGEDAPSDIAVLKIDAQGLRPASFGISDELRVGDEVAAIGNPLGDELSGTMTNGIVSAINRDVERGSRTVTMIQTNAAINEGNSGGPLLNLYGQVVGITNMKMVAGFSQATIEGIGFAIPTSEIQELVNQLMADGKVSGRPGIGITVGAMPEEAAEYYDLPYGLYISDVVLASDAYAKGVRPGDILTAVNGTPVYSTGDVGAIRDGFGVGESITLTLFRDGETFDVEVVLMDSNDLY